MTRGRFITFEGGEGAGKSTQALLLAGRLRQVGCTVIVTREPGGSPFAERIREILLSPQTPPHAALAEALLFSAARADHLDLTIRPALASGQWVISDRFADSTRVYQGTAGGVAVGDLLALERLTVGADAPDLTLILDLAADVGLARAATRGTPGTTRDAYEARDLAFHRRLRDGFLALAHAEPQRCAVIDAARAVDAIAGDIWRVVQGRLRVGI